MKHTYSSFLLATAAMLGLATSPISAQVALNNFGTYTQNFDGLPTSTSGFYFNNNSTLPGVYAQAMLAGSAYPSAGSPLPMYGNDGGQHPEANYYSFGMAGSSERAIGGIATSFYNNGIPITGTGYVAIRFVNRTNAPIANLEVSYAMEQWYNSGKIDKAQVGFDYLLPAGSFDGQMESSTSWVNVAELGVAAPSTATVIASKNGNAPANRRVLTATLTGLNLPVGKEVVLRWKYVLNKEANGNGLAIDDVSVTPQAGVVTTASGSQSGVFYYKGQGDVKQLTNWNSALPGSSAQGVQPTSFTLPNQVFYVTTPGTFSFDRNLILGDNSKLIVGDGKTSSLVTVKLQGNKADVLPNDAKGQPVPMLVDVANNGLVEFNGHDGVLPALGKLSAKSTVYFNTDRTSISITCPSFGNLQLASNDATLAGNVTVNGTLSLSKGSLLQLSVYDLTVLKGGKVTSDGAASYVQTNASGALRQTVSPSTTPTFFPVGQNTYNPAWLSQSAAGIEDVFGVCLSDSVFASYVTLPQLLAGSTKGEGRDKKGVGIPLLNSTFSSHTWYVTEQDQGSSNVTMTLQTAMPLLMAASSVALSHYHNGGWEADSKQKGSAKLVDLLTNNYQFTRTGITDFSPFSLSGDVAPLPIELVAFAASRKGSSVACTWTTASELNNAYFEVERSLDGQTFRPLGKVAGAGTSATAHTYRFVDAQPVATVAYYRLNQVDEAGTHSYSPVVTIAGLAAEGQLTASPNPTSGALALTLSNPEATTVRGTLTTVLGSSVLTFAQSVAAGTQVLPLDLSALPAGVYLLRLETPQGLQTLRVSKN